LTDQLNVQRLENNPILRPNMDDRMGDNLNGPSLIKIPEWVPNPLGKYYLYFGHHDGKYVRLAYSDDLTGPWRIHTPGALALEESNFAGHIASPDVHIDNESQQIRMYFHGSDSQLELRFQPMVWHFVVNLNYLAIHICGRSFGTTGTTQSPCRVCSIALKTA
jgi:hypothetical protein